MLNKASKQLIHTQFLFDPSDRLSKSKYVFKASVCIKQF